MQSNRRVIGIGVNRGAKIPTETNNEEIDITNEDTIDNIIMKLRPVKYEHRGDINRSYYGLLPTEVQSIFPDSVYVNNDDGVIIDIDYSSINILLLATVQRLYARNQILEQKVSQLEIQINKLSPGKNKN